MNISRHLLANLPFLSDIEGSELSRISQSLKLSNHAEKSLFIQQGAPASSILLLVAGTAHAFSKNENGVLFTFDILLPGRFLFPSRLENGAGFSPCTVRACTSVQLWSIDSELINTSTQLARAVACAAVHELGRQRSLNSIMVSPSPHDRIRRYMMHYMVRSANGCFLPYFPPQKILAECLATTRETVSRVISSMLHKGVISRIRDGFVVHDPLFFTQA